MSDDSEGRGPASYAALQERLLHAEGQIQALALTLTRLMAALEIHHGLDSEGLEQTLIGARWGGAEIEPYAVNLLREITGQMAAAREHRLYKLIYHKYGLDLDLSACKEP